MKQRTLVLKNYYMWLPFIFFLLTIPLANYMVGNVGTICLENGPCLIPVGFGLMAPSGVLVIAFALLLRDFVHETLGGRWALVAVFVGSVLSYFLADPIIAMASVAAYSVSEVGDHVVYTKLRVHSKFKAMLLSGVVGSILDSLVFLWIAFGSLKYIEGQVVGKIGFTLLASVLILLWRKGGK